MDTHPVADKASLSGIRKLIRSELNRAGIDPSLGFDCLVAITEACTNALVHGSFDQESPPRIAWDIDPDGARFYVQDFAARPWNSRTMHPSRTAPDAEAHYGGFGVDLMRGLMDEVDIDVGPDGTTVSLLKRFR